MIQTLPSPTQLPGIPNNIQNKLEFRKDVVYNDQLAKGKLDMYRSKAANPNTPAPCLLFIHGGSFISGDKSAIQRPAYHDLVLNCLRKGITVLSMNYTLTNTPYDHQGLFRPMMAIRSALAHIKKSAEILNIDPENMIYMGSSAGGYAAQWFSMKEFGAIDGDPLYDVSLLPVGAVSKEPNWTMNLFRIEEAQLWGSGVTIEDVLQDNALRANCMAWYGLTEEPTTSVDFNVFPALDIMWKLDPVGQEMFTPNMKPLYMISSGEDDGEAPDNITEYIHNLENPSVIHSAYAEQGVECYVWGVNPSNPVDSIPSVGRPEFQDWLFDKFGVACN